MLELPPEERVLDELLPPPKERVLDELLPPPNERVLDELLPPPNERVLDELLPPPKDRVLDELLLPTWRELDELLPMPKEREPDVLVLGVKVFFGAVVDGDDVLLRLPPNERWPDELPLLGAVVVVRVLLWRLLLPNERLPLPVWRLPFCDARAFYLYFLQDKSC